VDRKEEWLRGDVETKEMWASVAGKSGWGGEGVRTGEGGRMGWSGARGMGGGGGRGEDDGMEGGSRR